jgi:hypothetical protein
MKYSLRSLMIALLLALHCLLFAWGCSHSAGVFMPRDSPDLPGVAGNEAYLAAVASVFSIVGMGTAFGALQGGLNQPTVCELLVAGLVTASAVSSGCFIASLFL